MFTASDYEKLQQIMDESPSHQALLTKLLHTHEASMRTLRHEIGNSLTLLSGSVQFIESQHPEVSTFKYWNTLLPDISCMTGLLSALTRIGLREELQTEPIHSTEFFRQTALSFAAFADAQSFEFRSHIPAHLPMLHADRTKLREVLLNLLKNAAEAMHASNEPNVISFDVSADDTHLSIRVSDTGCGIPGDRIDTIFEPLVTFKAGGTGLGLALSKQIVEAHHGSLTVHSEEGRGSVFTVTLPL